MTAETLSLYAGVLLSLIFSYVPGLSDKYNKLGSEYKRLVMLLALLVVSGAIVGISCAGYGDIFGIAVTCDKQGVSAIISAFVAALISNQATYLISPQKKYESG